MNLRHDFRVIEYGLGHERARLHVAAPFEFEQVTFSADVPYRRESLESIINKSVNQTLSRTILTSGLTFVTVLALFLFGGPVLHGFSFALVVGIIIGTYSSVFIASPIVLFWHDFADQRKKRPAAVVGGPAVRPETVASPAGGGQAAARTAGKPLAKKAK